MAAQPQLVSGVQAIEAARALRGHHAQWPYPWIAAPLNSRHVFRAGTIGAPVAGTFPPASAPTLIVSYQVSNNYLFCLRGVLLAYTGAGWTHGDGNIVFSLTLNTPVGSTGTPAAAAAGIPFKDFGTVTVPLGSFVSGPWPIESGEFSVLHSRDILQATVVVNDTGVVTPGGNNLFTAVFVGYDWPEK